MLSLVKPVLPALLIAALLPAVSSVTAAGGAVVARGAVAVDDTTTSQDNLRTGWDPPEPELTPANVSGQTPNYTFGQVFRTTVTGQVYAQPLVVGSTVIVATEQDYVYSLNARTGAVVFKAFLGGRPSNDKDITFNAADQLERPGLLLMNGWVYAAFGSHCDHNPWAGFVDGVNVSTKATTEWSDEAGATNRLNLTPGLPINAGYDVRIPVTFTPHRKGRFTASYTFTWTDATGRHTITVHISGTATSG
jgi:PQQ-like domain